MKSQSTSPVQSKGCGGLVDWDQGQNGSHTATLPIAQNTKLANNWNNYNWHIRFVKGSGNDDRVERDYDLRNYYGSF